MISNNKTIFIVAGEASADVYAAEVFSELKIQNPNLRGYGVGGRYLREAGMEIILPLERLGIFGLSEWLHRAKEVFSDFHKVKQWIIENKPDVLLLLDLPDFNLALAKHAHKLKIPVYYYVSPQVWAWRKYRIHKIKKYVTQMMVVFPFEKVFYDQYQVSASFVGHPLTDRVSERSEYRSQLEISSNPVIAILPGSRSSELKYHAPVLKELVLRLLQKFGEHVTINVPVAPSLNLDWVAREINVPGVRFTQERAVDVVSRSDIAVVCSGTATLEVALTLTPSCLFYKVSRTSGWLFSRLFTYRGHIGIPNILLGREVIREYFQTQCTPDLLFAEVMTLLTQEKYRVGQITSLKRLRHILWGRGANKRVAVTIQSALSDRRTVGEGLPAQICP